MCIILYKVMFMLHCRSLAHKLTLFLGSVLFHSLLFSSLREREENHSRSYFFLTRSTLLSLLGCHFETILLHLLVWCFVIIILNVCEVLKAPREHSLTSNLPCLIYLCVQQLRNK